MGGCTLAEAMLGFASDHRDEINGDVERTIRRLRLADSMLCYTQRVPFVARVLNVFSYRLSRPPESSCIASRHKLPVSSMYRLLLYRVCVS